MIHGNLTGIRESVLNELERLYDAEFERDAFLPDRLLSILVRHTTALNREMLVYLGRDGTVLEIAIGWRASGASTPTRAGARGCRTWTCRRFGCCGSIPCAPWAFPTASAQASARRFWGRWSMTTSPS